MGCSRSFVRAVAAGLVTLAAGHAWAQDYVVTQVSSAFQTPPGSGVSQTTLATDDGQVSVTLPFTFKYYGVSFTTVSLCTNGFVQFGLASTSWNNTLNGTAFPLPTSGAGGNGVSMRGAICAYWDDLVVGSTYNTGSVKYWTSGSSPNRVFTAFWDSVTHYDQQPLMGPSFNFQIQLHETTGRIVLAYGPGSYPTQATGTTTSHTIGIQAPGADARYVEPGGLANPNNYGKPPSDYQFDPKITNFTGRLLYDRLVVDTSGIGNSSEQNIPLAGFPVQVMLGATVVASGTLDANGDFALSGAALDSSISSAFIQIQAQLTNITVRPAVGGQVPVFLVAQNVSFANDVNLGTLSIGNTMDPGGTGRAPFHVARTLQATHAWCASRTAATIPPLDVLLDVSSGEATTYVKAVVAPPAAAYLRVSTTASNPDAWDSHVLRKFYARHVLGVIAAHQTTAVDAAFDKATDDQNAFAEAFGYYVNAAITADSKFYDGINATTTNVIDLEAPALTTSPGTNVAGAVAAALFDLTDAANEAWDQIDGRTTLLDQTFKTVDSLTVPATALGFYSAWGVMGYEGLPLSTNFIHHRLVADDADEPNDSAATAKLVPDLGFVRPGRALSIYNEDWYEFDLADATNVLTAQIKYDRLLAMSLLLELRSASGSLIATGVAQGSTGPVVAQSGALPAGKYRVLVRHVSGVALPSYSLQAFAELAFSSGEFAPWTVGHPYNVPVQVRGGVRPYTLTVELPFVKPPGLVLDGLNARVTGTPSVAGHYGFVLSARDAADPSNVASQSIDFQVNEELDFAFKEFLAMPFGKPVDVTAPYSGGTAPFTSQIKEGALPSGITVPAGELRFTGTPDVPGGYEFAIEGVDVATSTAAGGTTAVVCVPFGVTPLATGKSACGFWFDAALGTSVKVSVKTSKKRAKRLLRALVLSGDGATELPATVKAGVGKASISFTAPSSGRWFVIAASDTGEATELSASGSLKAEKGGSGAGPANFVQGRTFTVEFGALAGASLSFSAKPDKSGLALQALYLVDPAGTFIPFVQSEVTEKSGAFSFTKLLPSSGTWKVGVGAKPGPQGTFTYSYKVKQPKGVTYSAE